jgi:hypothetical protein
MILLYTPHPAQGATPSEDSGQALSCKGEGKERNRAPLPLAVDTFCISQPLGRASLHPRRLRERESHESFDKLRTGFSEWQGEGCVNGIIRFNSHPLPLEFTLSFSKGRTPPLAGGERESSRLPCLYLGQFCRLKLPPPKKSMIIQPITFGLIFAF